MGCGGSKGHDLQKLTETQQASMRKQEQIAAQQQQQIKLQAEALENARIQQEITAKQFEEQKVMLLEQQAQLVQQQQEALQMALLAKQQAEQAANSAADQALKKAEAMKRRITPPAKPGKVNVIIQTDRTIPPNAIMKRRKQKDADGNIIERTDDHREECGGVGSDAVDAPNIAQVPVMVVKEKDKSKQNDDDDDDDEYEYQYEYQYQYQYTDDVPAGPQVMMAPPQGAAPIAAPILANPEPLFTKTFEAPREATCAAPRAAPQPADEGSEEADGTKSSENDTEKAGEEDYEYEYEDES